MRNQTLFIATLLTAVNAVKIGAQTQANGDTSQCKENTPTACPDTPCGSGLPRNEDDCRCPSQLPAEPINACLLGIDGEYELSWSAGADNGSAITNFVP